MTMRFASLGSGSEGNALLVATRQTLVLMDCGFGFWGNGSPVGALGGGLRGRGGEAPASGHPPRPLAPSLNTYCTGSTASCGTA